MIVMLIRDMLIEFYARQAIALAQGALVALRHIGLHIGFASKVELVLVAGVVHLQGMEILVLHRSPGGIIQLPRVVAIATDLIIDAQPAGIATSSKGGGLAIDAHVAKVTLGRIGGSHRKGEAVAVGGSVEDSGDSVIINPGKFQDQNKETQRFVYPPPRTSSTDRFLFDLTLPLSSFFLFSLFLLLVTWSFLLFSPQFNFFLFSAK